jgi:hypothetical protein
MVRTHGIAFEVERSVLYPNKCLGQPKLTRGLIPLQSLPVIGYYIVDMASCAVLVLDYAIRIVSTKIPETTFLCPDVRTVHIIGS